MKWGTKQIQEAEARETARSRQALEERPPRPVRERAQQRVQMVVWH